MSRLIIFIHLFFTFHVAFSQERPSKYKGYFFEVGKISTKSLTNLNTSLGKNSLPTFDNQMTYLKFGFTRINTKKIYYGFIGESAIQTKSNIDYSLSLSCSHFGLTGGYKIFDKKGLAIIPTINIGIGSTTLSVSEKPTPSTNNFNTALFVSKKSNAIALPQFTTGASLLLLYHIKVGNDKEKVSNGEVVINRWLPVGLEIGFKQSKDIGEWTQLEKLSNSPYVNFSGFFFAVRVGAMAKLKTANIQ